MRLLALRTDSPDLAEARGALLCHDVRGAGRRGGVLFKGSALGDAEVDRLAALIPQTVHVVQLEADDVREDEAARRAWATVNATSGGGKKSGSGRGKKTNNAPAKKGGASSARTAEQCPESAKKAARTRACNRAAKS